MPAAQMLSSQSGPKVQRGAQLVSLQSTLLHCCSSGKMDSCLATAAKQASAGVIEERSSLVIQTGQD